MFNFWTARNEEIEYTLSKYTCVLSLIFISIVFMYIVHVHQFLLQLKRLNEKNTKIIYKSMLAYDSFLFNTPYPHNIKSSAFIRKSTPNIQ